MSANIVEKPGCFQDEFEMIGEIGQGGFGKVFRVKNKLDNKLYAMKRIDPQVSGQDWDEQEKVELLGEINVLTECRDEFVVKYFGSWFEGKHFFIQMELCRGSLEEVIENKPDYFKRAPNDAMNPIEYYISILLFKEIVECVKYLHESNPPIMHRDLKPANILFKENPSKGRFLKLGDFGLAKIDAMKTKTRTENLGTDRYRAPEMIKNSSNPVTRYSLKVDIYSLGFILDDFFGKDFAGQGKILKNQFSKKRIQKFETMAALMTERDHHKRPSCDEILICIQKMSKERKQLEQFAKNNNWSSDEFDGETSQGEFLDKYINHQIVKLQEISAKKESSKSCLIQ